MNSGPWYSVTLKFLNEKLPLFIELPGIPLVQDVVKINENQYKVLKRQFSGDSGRITLIVEEYVDVDFVV